MSTQNVDPAQLHFMSLPAERQREVIRRLHARGYDAPTIASMSGLSADVVARMLADD